MDYPLAATGIAARGVAQWVDQYRYRDTTDYASLHPGDVGPYDRWAIGFYSRPLDHLSSVLTGAEFAVPVAINAWDIATGKEARYGVLTDLLIYTEVYCFSSSLAIYAKALRWHPRPLAFTENAPDSERRGGDAGSSFFSAHTTSAFASAIFTGYTFQLKHPDSPLVPWIWAGMSGTAATVGALRIYSGKHFPSDVLMGAMVGGLCGYGIPKLHLNPVAKAVNEMGLHDAQRWELHIAMIPISAEDAAVRTEVDAHF